MRHLDIGTISDKKQSKTRAKTRRQRTSHRSPLKTVVGLLLLGCLVFALYSYLPPIKEAIAGMLSGSASVVSFVTQGGKPELKQDGGKTNVLLIGIDRREEEPFSYTGSDGQTYYTNFRSDTIMLASYNHDSERVTMLALPRDLWVTAPAFGQVKKQSMKINGIYGLGDSYEYPGGGQALLSDVVSDITGVPIHYTARIDFSGFEKAVDAVGGLDINVENAFTDYAYPIEGMETAWPEYKRYKTITFKKGLQQMDGKTALEFSRSRHAAGIEGSDFARSRRQQLVIAAFKDKVMSTSTLLNPATMVKLVQTLGDSFSTTLALTEIPTVIDLAQNTSTSEIVSYNLDDRTDHPGGILYAPSPAQYGGAYVLVPKQGPSQIKRFVQQIFSSQGYQESTPSATILQP